MTAAVAMAVPGIAFADNVVNDVDVAAGDNSITAGGSTTVGYKINGTGGDGQPGCNADDSTPATVTLDVPAGVTASTTTLTFSACNVFQHVTFSSSVAGNYDINASVSDAGVGRYSIQANWTLHVSATRRRPTPRRACRSAAWPTAPRTR